MSVPFDQLPGMIWFDGKLIPGPEAKIHVLTHGLHYASAVFEGERAYGGQIFRSTAHSERLKRSANVLDFEIPYSVAEIDAAKKLVVEKNGKKEAYVRPVAWRGSEMMGVSAQSNTIHLAIASWEWPSYFDPEQRLKGIRLDLADYRRPDPRTAPCSAKAAGLYMICTISKHRAERKGYADAMMLDWEGRVAECTGANLFIIVGDTLVTPTTRAALPGITRRTVLEIAAEQGIEAVVRDIWPMELHSADGAFVCGSGAGIVPIGSFDGRSSLRTWLTSILRFKIVDLQRRAVRERATADIGEQASQSDDDSWLDDFFDETGHWRSAPQAWNDPESALDQRRFWEAFEKCLAGLPGAAGRVFFRREVLGDETAAICEDEKITANNCWVIMHRARLALRTCLEMNWFGRGAAGGR